MKNYFSNLLQTFDYADLKDWATSLAPSWKYGKTIVIMVSATSLTTSYIDTVFGIDWLAFAGFVLVMITELVSGIWASAIRKEQFSSMRLSRFGFKLFYYLVLMAIPHLFADSYQHHHEDLAASIFQWLHVFLTVHIVLENIISILENSAVINGDDKAAWINAIQTKINGLLS